MSHPIQRIIDDYVAMHRDLPKLPPAEQQKILTELAVKRAYEVKARKPKERRNGP